MSSTRAGLTGPEPMSSTQARARPGADESESEPFFFRGGTRAIGADLSPSRQGGVRAIRAELESARPGRTFVLERLSVDECGTEAGRSCRFGLYGSRLGGILECVWCGCVEWFLEGREPVGLWGTASDMAN